MKYVLFFLISMYTSITCMDLPDTNFQIQSQDDESETEFIQRTQQPKEVPIDYYKNYIQKPANERRIHVRHSVQMNPNNSKIILSVTRSLTAGEYSSDNKSIYIIDAKNNERIFYKPSESIDDCPSIAIAVSSSGSQFAEIAYEAQKNAMGELIPKLLLTVYNSNAKKQFEIPEEYKDVNAMDFNKQETAIIVHSKKAKNNKKPYIIFPL